MFNMFNLSGLFGRRAGRLLVAAAVVALAAVATALDGVYTVGEQEQAVITMFGDVVRVDTAGLYFKIPWLQTRHTVDMTTHGVGIGYMVDRDGQNITVEDEGVMITSDFNLVNVDFYLEYRVSDPVAYLYQTDGPEDILRNMVLACIRSTVVNYTVDDVITTGKNRIQMEVREKLSAMLREHNVGLQCVNITVQDAAPPTQEIARAFKEVETAKQGRETTINGAKKYRSEQMPLAEAQADQIIRRAEAVKQARIAEARGQAERFARMYGEYAAYPQVTRRRLYFEAMESVLPGVRVIVTDGQTRQLMPLDKF